MPKPVLTSDELRSHVARMPRIALANLPTPLEEAPRFAETIGAGRVFVKRDDCTGLLFGGNKVRHAEFLVADALQKQADVLVWGAGIQSNNCRVTAAACAKLGLECRLYLSQQAGRPEMQGNLLLDHLVGAKVELVDSAMGPELNARLGEEAAKLRAQGRRPYAWDTPRSVPIATVSYVLAAAELAEDLKRIGVTPAAIYVSSSGSTGAGLVLGLWAMGIDWPVRSVGYIRWPWNVPAEMAKWANDAAQLIELPLRLKPDDIDYTDEQIGADYQRLTSAGREALRLIARTEALLLDPIYTARAAAQLISDVRSKHLPANSDVVFIHTGGAPAVFADVEQIIEA